MHFKKFMKIFILVCLVLFQTSCTSKCKNEKQQVTPQEMLENIRKAGPDDLPVSDSANKMLDKAQEHIQQPSSISSSKDFVGLVSKDCRAWQDYKNLKNIDEFLFRKPENKGLSFIDESKSVMVTLDPTVYYRVYNDKLIGFIGSRGFLHRPLKKGVLEKGLAGILQGLALTGGEIDQWKFGLSKKNEPILLRFLHDKGNNIALKNYTAIVCTRDSCLITGSKGGSESLKIKSLQAIALKQMEVFSNAKIQALDKMCADLTSNFIIDDYNDTINHIHKSCNIEIDDRVDFDNLTIHCSTLRKRIIPLLKQYQ